MIVPCSSLWAYFQVIDFLKSVLQTTWRLFTFLSASRNYLINIPHQHQGYFKIFTTSNLIGTV